MHKSEIFNTNHTIKETMKMESIVNKIKSLFITFKTKLQTTFKTEDLDLYEFEQLESKRAYRPIRNHWEQI